MCRLGNWLISTGSLLLSRFGVPAQGFLILHDQCDVLVRTVESLARHSVVIHSLRSDMRSSDHANRDVTTRQDCLRGELTSILLPLMPRKARGAWV